MKKLLLLFSMLAFMVSAYGQTYSPTLSTTAINKPMGANGYPLDARSYFYNSTKFLFRPYQSLAEVLSYLPTALNRTGQFPIIINTGGTINSTTGVLTGGTNAEWWFKDGVDDNNLVLKQSQLKNYKDQVWLYLGDSFGVREIAFDAIKSNLGITVVSNSVNGSCIARGRENAEGFFIESGISRLKSFINTANVSGIIIELMSNDNYYQTPIGAMGDLTGATFYGAIDSAAKMCLKRFPPDKIRFVGMIPRNGINFQNSLTQQQYRNDQVARINAMWSVCNKYGIMFENGYSNFGFTYDNLSANTSDGVHPDNSSGKLLYGIGLTNNFDNNIRTSGGTGGAGYDPSVQFNNNNSFQITRQGSDNIGEGGFINFVTGSSAAVIQVGPNAGQFDFWFNKDGTGWGKSISLKKGGIVQYAPINEDDGESGGFLYRDSISGDYRASSVSKRQIRTLKSFWVNRPGSSTYGQGGFLQFAGGPNNALIQLTDQNGLDFYSFTDKVFQVKSGGINLPILPSTASSTNPYFLIRNTNGDVQQGSISDLSLIKMVSAPVASTSSGSNGQVAFDVNYIYWYAGARWNKAKSLDSNGNTNWTRKSVTNAGNDLVLSDNNTSWFWIHADSSGTRISTPATLATDGSGNRSFTVTAGGAIIP